MPLTYALASLDPDAFTLRLAIGARRWVLGVNLWPPRVRFTRDWLAELRDGATVSEPSVSEPTTDPTLRKIIAVCGAKGAQSDGPPVVAEGPRLETVRLLGGKATGEEWGFTNPDAAARVAARACDEGDVDGLLCLNNDVSRFAASAVRHRLNPSASSRAEALNLGTRAAAQIVTMLRQIDAE